MATCDRTTLLSDSDCYQCLSDRDLLLVTVTFLCKILQRLDPMASCAAEDVRADSAQYTFMGDHELRAAMVHLLCEINAAGGVSPGVVIRTVDPVADPGVESQIWINRTSGQVWYWNDTTTAWVLLIA